MEPDVNPLAIAALEDMLVAAYVKLGAHLAIDPELIEEVYAGRWIITISPDTAAFQPRMWPSRRDSNERAR